MEDWNQKRAHELVTFRTGKLDSNAAEEDGKYPFFTCAQHTYLINSYAFDTECVLLAGNNAAGVFPLKYYSGKFNAYQRTYVIEPKDRNELSIKYFYYYLRTLLKAFEQQATGVTTKFLTLKILNSFVVRFPRFEVQENIAAILVAYDDLIETNKRRIALLEALTEELYCEWFVRMCFPGYEKVKFEKGVPTEWEYERLDKLCSLIKRGISPSYSEESEMLVINQKCIRDSRLNLSKARTHMTNVPNEKFIQYGDALINSTGVGTLGRVSIVEFEPNKLTVDSHVTICRANEKKVGIHYLSHTLCKLKTYFEFMAAGSTGQVELNRSLIAGIKVNVPSDYLQNMYAEQVSPIWEQKQKLVSANERLTETKNLLLPRLITGKLSVEEVDIQIPPSMLVESIEREAEHA